MQKKNTQSFKVPPLSKVELKKQMRKNKKKNMLSQLISNRTNLAEHQIYTDRIKKKKDKFQILKQQLSTVLPYVRSPEISKHLYNMSRQSTTAAVSNQTKSRCRSRKSQQKFEPMLKSKEEKNNAKNILNQSIQRILETKFTLINTEISNDKSQKTKQINQTLPIQFQATQQDQLIQMIKQQRTNLGIKEPEALNLQINAIKIQRFWRIYRTKKIIKEYLKIIQELLRTEKSDGLLSSNQTFFISEEYKYHVQKFKTLSEDIDFKEYSKKVLVKQQDIKSLNDNLSNKNEQKQNPREFSNGTQIRSNDTIKTQSVDQKSMKEQFSIKKEQASTYFKLKIPIQNQIKQYQQEHKNHLQNESQGRINISEFLSQLKQQNNALLNLQEEKGRTQKHEVQRVNKKNLKVATYHPTYSIPASKDNKYSYRFCKKNKKKKIINQQQVIVPYLYEQEEILSINIETNDNKQHSKQHSDILQINNILIEAQKDENFKLIEIKIQRQIFADQLSLFMINLLIADAIQQMKQKTQIRKSLEKIMQAENIKLIRGINVQNDNTMNFVNKIINLAYSKNNLIFDQLDQSINPLEILRISRNYMGQGIQKQKQIVPNSILLQFEKLINTRLKLEKEYENEFLESRRVKLIKILLNSYNKAVFEAFNECLNRQTKYFQTGTPLPWKFISQFQKQKAKYFDVDDSLEIAKQNLLKILEVQCGIHQEKISLSSNKNVQCYLEILREERQNQMLVQQLQQNEHNWKQGIQQLRVELCLSDLVMQALILEMTRELFKFQFRI